MKKNIKKTLSLVLVTFAILAWAVFGNYNTSIMTSADVHSNRKISWGIKNAENHEQPDLGKINLELINKYNGIAMGSKDKKYVYLTFDSGYEAGFTEKILNTLKEKNVTGTFFITAHYLNTAEDLVKRMIDEGHIVGNQSPHSLMDV